MKTEHIAQLISTGKLTAAFSATRALITNNDADYTHRLDTLYEAYRDSLTYQMQGVVDPERGRIMQWIRRTLFEVAQELEFRYLLSTSTARYYTRSITSFNAADALWAYNHAHHDADTTQEAERLFEAVWTNKRPTPEDISILIAEEDVYTQGLILSAITLSYDYYASEQYLLYPFLALERYGDIADLRARAIVAIVLMASYAWMPIYAPILQPKLERAIKKDAKLVEELRQAFLQIYRSRDTEKISERIRHDIRSSWERVDPQIQKRLSKITDATDIQSLDISDWLHPLEHSGIQDSMKEIGDLLNKGHDVFYGEFSQAKAHPYFRNIHTWFASISERNALYRRIKQHNPNLESIMSLPLTICDSDRYSILLVMEALLDKVNIERLYSSIPQEFSQSDMPSVTTRLRSYIDGLFRFCKLYERKSEHTDYFARDLRSINNSLLNTVYDVPQLLAEEGKLHTAQLRYTEANHCYRRLIQLEPTESAHYIARACILIELEEYTEALGLLTTAELIAGETPRIIRLMAHSHYQMGHYDQAIVLLRRLTGVSGGTSTPGHLIRIATAHIALGQWDRALETGYEYELMHCEDKQSKRIIALSLLNLARAAEAAPYYEQLLADEPSVSDIINAAHTALTLGRYTEASAHYRRAYRLMGSDAFVQGWADEVAMLAPLGIDPELLAAIPEYVAL